MYKVKFQSGQPVSIWSTSISICSFLFNNITLLCKWRLIWNKTLQRRIPHGFHLRTSCSTFTNDLPQVVCIACTDMNEIKEIADNKVLVLPNAAQSFAKSRIYDIWLFFLLILFLLTTDYNYMPCWLLHSIQNKQNHL